MMRKLFLMCVSVTLWCVLGVALWAQASASSADLTGVVTDASKAVIPGAAVTAINTATKLTRSTVTNETGEYRMVLLPPGIYDVRAEAKGFTTGIKKGIILTVGQVAELGFELTVGATSTEVVISSEAAIIEVERSQQSDTITQTPIVNLPINGRNFLNFTLLTPGVVEANPNIPTLQQIPNSGLSFGGQNARSNSVSIDGANYVDDASNGIRPTISQEAVQEFQINRSGYNAEFGNGSSGSVNIVTKSGTNEFHGNLFEFFRHEKLDARNPLDFSEQRTGSRSPFKRNQPGFTLGGPIKKDRTFFFISYEALIQRESSFVTVFPDASKLAPTASQTALAGFLAGLPPSPQTATLIGLGQLLPLLLSTGPTPPPAVLATLPLFAQQIAVSRGNTFNMLKNADGRQPFKNTSNNASLRLDHQFSPRDQISARFNFNDANTFGTNVGGQNALSAGTRVDEQQEAVSVSETHIFNDHVINEGRFQYARHVFNLKTIDPFGPNITISGIGNFGRDFTNPTLRTGQRWQGTDNLTYTRGNHSFKFGGDVNYLPFNDATVAIFLGGNVGFNDNTIPLFLPLFGGLGPATFNALNQFLLTFPTSPFKAFAPVPGFGNVSTVLLAPLTALQTFNLGLPVRYNQGFGNPVTTQANTQLAWFAQDSWKVNRKLQLNYGLRYDVELQPTPLHRDKNNFAPRFGFAYDPWGHGKTVIRGSYGIFYSPLYQSVAFASRVLGQRQIQNVLRLFVPGSSNDSAAIWQYIVRNTLGRRTLTAQELQANFGLTAGPPTLQTQEVAPDAVNTYVQQGSFGIDHELGRDWSISANYLWNHGSKVIRNRDINLRPTGFRPGIGTLFQGINTTTGTSNGNFPGFLARFLIETSAASTYHGMSVSLNKRFSHHNQFLVAYTLGKAIDDSTDLNQDLSPFDSNNLRNERSLSTFDVRQRLVASAVLQSPWKGGSGTPAWQRVFSDFTLAPIVTARSGFPFNLLTGFDENSDLRENTDRPPFEGRNTGHLPNFVTVDLRVMKRFNFGESGKSLDFIWEGFNLFNRVNFKTVNNVVGLNASRHEGVRGLPPTSPFAFTQAYDPRQLQFAVKINF